MITVRKQDIQKTCDACPAQWEGRTVEGVTVYIRYRFGSLTVDSPFDFNMHNGEFGEMVGIFGLEHGDEMSGVMDDETMYELTAPVIEWRT